MTLTAVEHCVLGRAAHRRGHKARALAHLRTASELAVDPVDHRAVTHLRALLSPAPDVPVTPLLPESTAIPGDGDAGETTP